MNLWHSLPKAVMNAKVEGETGQELGRDLQRFIKQTKLMRLRKSAQLKKVRGWDSMRAKYCERLPISYFSLGMGLWPLLEAGTGLSRPFVWTKTSTHTSSCKPQRWGRRQSCSSPAQKGSSLLMPVLERWHNWKSAEVTHVWDLQEQAPRSVWLGCPF